MRSRPASAEPETEPDPQAEDAEYYHRVLHELIDMGADLARTLHPQALSRAEAVEPGEHPDAVSAPDPTVAFDRISRAIRHSIILARKLGEPAQAPGRRAASARTAARRRIIRDVEDAIQRSAEDEQAETLHAEFLDRLDAADLDDEIDDRAVPEIIADICRDLGLAAPPGAQPWKRRAPKDIAALCARAASPRAAPIPSIVVHAAPPAIRTGSDPRPAIDAAGARLLDRAARFRGS